MFLLCNLQNIWGIHSLITHSHDKHCRGNVKWQHMNFSQWQCFQQAWKMVQTLPCGSLFWNINIVWLSMHNSICQWMVKLNVCVCSQARSPKRQGPWGKNPGQSFFYLYSSFALLGALPQYQVILLSQCSWKPEKQYPHLKWGQSPGQGQKSYSRKKPCNSY